MTFDKIITTTHEQETFYGTLNAIIRFIGWFFLIFFILAFIFSFWA